MFRQRARYIRPQKHQDDAVDCDDFNKQSINMSRRFVHDKFVHPLDTILSIKCPLQRICKLKEATLEAGRFKVDWMNQHKSSPEQSAGLIFTNRIEVVSSWKSLGKGDDNDNILLFLSLN